MNPVPRQPFWNYGKKKKYPKREKCKKYRSIGLGEIVIQGPTMN